MHEYSYTVQPIKGVFGGLRANGYDFLSLADVGEGEFTLQVLLRRNADDGYGFQLRDAENQATPSIRKRRPSSRATGRNGRCFAYRSAMEIAMTRHRVTRFSSSIGRKMQTVELFTAEMRLDGKLIAEGSEDFSGKNVTWPKGEYDLVVAGTRGNGPVRSLKPARAGWNL